MFPISVLVFVRPRLFPEADTGFRQSQASLIWRELEEEEEGFDEGPRGLFRSGLRRRQTQRMTNRDEEDEDRTEGSVRRHRGQRLSDYPDDDCVRYFVLGTVAAMFALFVNLVYPLLYKANWPWAELRWQTHTQQSGFDPKINSRGGS